MENKVMLVSKVDANVIVDIPELRYSRTWARRGTKYPMDKEILEQALYDPSFSYLINNGVLYIEDMDVKKELGLEPEEAVEPENIIDLNENLLKRMVGPMPESELAKTFEKLSDIQRNEVAEYAINHSKDLNMNKAEWLSQKTHKDIINAIRLKNAAEEEIKEG